MEPIVSLEIGTSCVRALVGEWREDGDWVVTARGECESRGVRKGELISAELAQQCVANVIQQVEQQGDLEVHEVYLSVSGAHIEAMQNRAQLGVGGEISANDVQHVQDAAKMVALPPEREVLHHIIQKFDVDGASGVSPIGMEGSQLAVDMLILHGVATRLRNMVRVVKGTELDVADIYFSGLCASQAALSVEQKQQGVLLIDLGGGTTDYVVYAKEVLADAGVLGVGGDHVTSDLASAFRISTMEAETLKKEHGTAMVQAVSRTKRIPLPVNPGEAPRMARLLDVQTIIHLRMEELFHLIKARLQQQQRLSFLGAGVVLTGGGAHLRDVASLAEKVFGLPCTVAQLPSISQMPFLSEPEYATSVGLLSQGMKEARRQAQGSGLLGSLRRFFGGRG